MNKNVTIVLTIILLIIILVGGLSLYKMNKEVSTNIETENETPTPPETVVKETVKNNEKDPASLNFPSVPKNPSISPATVFTAGVIVGSAKGGTLGEYLTDKKGMTLYVFADDKKLESSCKDECLKNWPPFVYDNQKLTDQKDVLSQRMNVIKRTDGTYQYAYGEKPVYYYMGDKVKGDTNGNNVNPNKWSIVLITK